MTDLQIRRQGHVDLLSIRSHSVQEEGVVQGAVPHCLEAVESPKVENRKMFSHQHTYSEINLHCFFFFLSQCFTKFVGCVWIQQQSFNFGETNEKLRLIL